MILNVKVGTLEGMYKLMLSICSYLSPYTTSDQPCSKDHFEQTQHLQADIQFFMPCFFTMPVAPGNYFFALKLYKNITTTLEIMIIVMMCITFDDR